MLTPIVAVIAGGLVVLQVMGRQATALAGDHQIRRALGMTHRQIAAALAITNLPAIVAGGLTAVIGAALLTLLREWLKDVLPKFMDQSGNFEIVFFGILVIVMLHRARMALREGVDRGVRRAR